MTKGSKMGIVMEKVDIIVKLKEKIADAKMNNINLAQDLQRLLDNIMKDGKKTPAI